MADYKGYDMGGGEGGGFMKGLLTGTVIGAGIGLLLAPKAGSDLRGALGQRARHASEWSSAQYRKAGDAATQWSDKGREFVDRAREAMAHGTEGIRRDVAGSEEPRYP